jgi:NADH-quinone oxidoreductase subunit C
MDARQIHELLAGRFGPAILASDPQAIDPWIEVSAERLPDICRWLRDEPRLRFDMLNCVTGVDYFQPDAKKPAPDGPPRIELMYHLSSLPCRQRLVLKASVPRWKDDVQGQLPEVPSVSGVWHTADWHEREVFDLVGVRFTGHPDLRRILLPEDWEGHPLRKDYCPPSHYHGIPRE